MTGDGVSIEYGVRVTSAGLPTWAVPFSSERAAQRQADAMRSWPGAVVEVVSREVGPWTPVDGDRK